VYSRDMYHFSSCRDFVSPFVRLSGLPMKCGEICTTYDGSDLGARIAVRCVGRATDGRCQQKPEGDGGRRGFITRDKEV
jgi:hypothetical protein